MKVAQELPHALANLQKAKDAGVHRPPSRLSFGTRAALKGLGFGAWSVAQFAKIGFVRRAVEKRVEEEVRRRLRRAQADWPLPPRVADDMMALGHATIGTAAKLIAEGRVGGPAIRKILGVLAYGVLTSGAKRPPQSTFLERYGMEAPGLLVISPTNACNLRCQGCYANSTNSPEKLAWPVFERIVTEARDQWGAHLMVISGGEPLIYESEGKGVLDLVERTPDFFYIMYTNGTLIDDKTARRLGRLGNITPGISLEGLKARTDKRRGTGTFERVMEAAKRLRENGVMFGVSLTATRENADEILSDEAVEHYFGNMGAAYAWIFHYMPIGRAPSLGLLPTPAQRLMLLNRCTELMRERRLFVADFWNGGTLSKGCISAGRPGGYLAINAAGLVSPCVFMPFAPANINEYFAAGKTLTDVWEHPFFAKIRAWQKDYGYEKNPARDARRGNWMMPCPIRDHFAEFSRWLKEFDLTPLDENARAAAEDPSYHAGMKAYGSAVASVMEPVWKESYVGPCDEAGK